MTMAEWYGLTFFVLLLITYAIAWWRETGLKREYNLLEGAYLGCVNELANMERDLRSTQAALNSLAGDIPIDENGPAPDPSSMEDGDPPHFAEIRRKGTF